MSTDDAPAEVGLSQSKDEIKRQITTEKLHHSRQKKNERKRKPNWAKSQKKNKTKLKEMSASQFKESEFSEFNEPQTKKRRKVGRLNRWMEESDLFHDTLEDNHDHASNANVIDTIAIDDSDNYDFQKTVPKEVIDLFAKAIAESKTDKELEDKWQKIIETQSKKYANLKHKLSQFDKVFIDGFQIEVNGINRLNVSALKRALRMKHFSTKNHHRIKFNKKMCYGSTKPSFAFVEQGSNEAKQEMKPHSFWGERLPHLQKVIEQDQLEKWLLM